MPDELTGEPCSTPSPSTDELRARYRFPSQPLKSLSLGDVADLLVAFAAGETSEGCLADMTGIDPDTLRGMYRDALSRSDRLFKSWRASEEARFRESQRSSGSRPSGSESGTKTTGDTPAS